MEAAESTGWLLAELVYRKITEDKRDCKSVCHFCGPRLGNVSLENAALGLMSAPSFGFSSSKCFMLKGVGRELGKAWSRAACPLQLTWGSAVKLSVMGKRQCAEDGVLPQTTCVKWTKRGLRGERCSSVTEHTSCQEGEMLGLYCSLDYVVLICPKFGLLSAPHFAQAWSKKNT